MEVKQLLQFLNEASSVGYRLQFLNSQSYLSCLIQSPLAFYWLNPEDYATSL